MGVIQTVAGQVYSDCNIIWENKFLQKEMFSWTFSYVDMTTERH